MITDPRPPVINTREDVERRAREDLEHYDSVVLPPQQAYQGVRNSVDAVLRADPEQLGEGAADIAVGTAETILMIAPFVGLAAGRLPLLRRVPVRTAPRPASQAPPTARVRTRPLVPETPRGADPPPPEPAEGTVSSARRGDPRLVISRTPRIDLLEIKPAGQEELGFRQAGEYLHGPGLDHRHVRVGVATYDRVTGDVILEVRYYETGETIARRHLGQIRKSTLAQLHAQAGNSTARFGSLVEGHVRRMVERATGQRYGAHHPNANGPDGVPRQRRTPR